MLEDAVEKVSSEELACWGELLPVLTVRVRARIMASPDFYQWLGTADPAELPRLVEHHGRLWHTALHLRSARALESSLLRAYSSLIKRGFAFDYFVAEFMAWQNALAAEIANGGPTSVAFFERLLELHPELVEMAVEGVEELPPLEPQARAALDAVLAGEQERLQTLLMEAGDAQRRRVIITEVMHRVGELWADGSIDVATEHAATALVIRAIHQLGSATLRSCPPTSKGGRGREAVRVLIALPSGECHELAALLIRDAVAVAGYRVAYTGPDLPLHSIASWLEPNPVEVLIVPAVILHHLPPTAEMIRRARAVCPGIKVVVGGQAYACDPELWCTVGADVGLQTIPELLQWLQAAFDADEVVDNPGWAADSSPPRKSSG